MSLALNRNGRRLIIAYFLGLLMTFNSHIILSQDIQELKVIREIVIDDRLSEISGMAYHNGRILALNDSGNGSSIYSIDPESGEVTGKFRLKEIENFDWEELTVSEDRMYIGDFGNNRGVREELVIYDLKIADLSAGEYADIKETRYSYGLQKDYSRRSHKHEFDSEAMVVDKGQIYTFTKDWTNFRSSIYKIDLHKGGKVFPEDSYDVGMLVTGAYYNRKGKMLLLCGYRDHHTYLWIFRNADTVDFSSNSTMDTLPELDNTQVESVFVKDGIIYLGSERTVKSQAIYLVNLPEAYE
jgi:outer membrane protein assembly factor BamB